MAWCRLSSTIQVRLYINWHNHDGENIEANVFGTSKVVNKNTGYLEFSSSRAVLQSIIVKLYKGAQKLNNLLLEVL